MDILGNRVLGALLLLLGVSFLAAGLYTGQLDKITELLKTILRTVPP